MHSSRVLAKVQGRRLCGTFWVTQVIGVTQNVYGKLVGRASGCGHPSCRRRNQWRMAHPLNSELALDFSGASRFAVLAKGGCLGFFVSLVAITTNKKGRAESQPRPSALQTFVMMRF